MVIDQEEILYQKAVRYCGYQERTEKEVREKLCAWGVKQKSEEERIAQALKENNFLNEARYVAAFIRGKFLGRQWGKKKLLAALAKKEMGQALIQEGLATIETTDYLHTLRYVADRKKKSLAGETFVQKRKKLMNYLLQKGYEPELVHQTVQELVVQQQN